MSWLMKTLRSNCMIRVCDNRFKNNRANPDLIVFGNKSKPMTQNYMYLGCTP